AISNGSAGNAWPPRSVRRSADHDPAVGRDPLTGEVRAVVAGEEEEDGRDLPGTTLATERDRGADTGHDRGRDAGVHRRVDHTRAHDVHADVAWRHLTRQAAAEREDATLRGAVVALADPGERRDARGVHDRTRDARAAH